jgi:hypothetical protein
MDIYLVPLGADRDELYCEIDDHAVRTDDEKRSRWRRKASDLFHRTLLYLETERRRRLALAEEAEPRTRLQRIRDRALAWLAERVAEQRLLWHLRSQTAATLHHPDDLTAAHAEAIVRRSLRHDGRRHLGWAVVHTLAYLAALPLSALPGPNFLTWFFGFRALGHLLSWMGTRQGRSRVRWSFAACPPLTALRRLPSTSPADRAPLAREVAQALNLPHLDTFVERMALGGP